MSELLSQEKTRQQPAFDPAPAELAPLPPQALARRRRIVRLVGLMTVVGGLGLSAIPGPKRSSHAQITETENGRTTVIHRFTYHRPYGAPFVVAKAEFDEEGSIDKFGIDGENLPGILGNMVVAFGIAMVAAFFLGRRR